MTLVIISQRKYPFAKKIEGNYTIKIQMGCCNFIYNGGFDGSVTIEEKGNEPGKIKGKVKVRVSELEAFIAAKYKQELIGKLEQASDNDILSGRWFSEQIL